MPESDSSKLAYAIAFLLMVAYGSYGVFVRWTDLPGKEQYIVFWRTLFGLVFVLAFLIITRRLGQLKIREHYVLLAASGAAVALQSYASSKAINLLPVSDAIFIIYLAPVLVAAFAPLVLGEKLEGWTVAALAVALGGLALISFAGHNGAVKSLNAKGVLFALLSAISYAALILTLKIIRKSTPALAVYVYQSVVILVMMIPFAGFSLPQMTAKGWASMVVMGAFHSALLGMVYITVVKRVKAQHMGVLSYIDPVSSTLFAWALLGEVPGWQTFVGGALIITAGIIVLSVGAPEPDVQPL